MKFTYTYRSSDGERHTAEIEAESRDAAFGRLRTEYGIKPIKVMAAGQEPGRQDQDTQDTQDTQGAKARSNILGVLGVLGVLAILALAILALTGRWRAMAGARDARPYQVMTPQGLVTLRMAEPLPRQTIPGDRQRIKEAASAFKYPAEAWLARYAEPGRKPAAEPAARPASADFEAALREPVRISSADFTEVVDLKRIVVGIKREMHAYLAGGGTVEQYLAELEKRQKLEVSYRERAEQRLKELLVARSGSAPYQGGNAAGARDARPYQVDKAAGARDARPYQAEAYAYWLKANAQLKSMGIYELPLPDALRAYQTGLDIEE